MKWLYSFFYSPLNLTHRPLELRHYRPSVQSEGRNSTFTAKWAKQVTGLFLIFIVLLFMLMC